MSDISLARGADAYTLLTIIILYIITIIITIIISSIRGKVQNVSKMHFHHQVFYQDV